MKNSTRRACLILLQFTLIAAATVVAEPNSQLKVTYTQRIRIETTDNATQLDYDSLAGSSYMRNRTSLMMQVFPSHSWELGLRLVNEFRYYFIPERRQFSLDEVVIDQFYCRKDSVFNQPLTVILGRQNITLGEGFIVAEGGPLDGSRTAYFNALNLGWNFVHDQSLSLIFVHQPRKDEWLPVIHDQHKVMVEQREQAVIGYYARKGNKFSPQVYTVYKHLGREGSRRPGDIACLGGRLQTVVTPKLTATIEAAKQFGWWGTRIERDPAGDIEYPGRHHSALGGYAYLELKTGWPMYHPQSFTVGGLYLTGDDPVSDTYEGWEPMFSRYPKWSESYAYTLTRESGSAYWTNFASIFVKTSAKLSDDLTLSLEYHHLLAPERMSPASSFQPGNGRDRGNLVIGKLIYKAGPHLSGHIWWESFEPGDFYAAGMDHSSWMRTEAFLTF